MTGIELTGFGGRVLGRGLSDVGSASLSFFLVVTDSSRPGEFRHPS
jgi:hypothetical protein